MKSARTVLLTVVLSTVLVSATALGSGLPAGGSAPYGGIFQRLSDTEAAALERGEMVVRPLENPGKLSLTRDDNETKEIVQRIQTTRPNYTAEFMAFVPIQDGTQVDSMLSRIAAALSDVKSYIGIPYWSKQHKTTYALFDTMDVLSRKARQAGKGETIEVRQHMEPFDEFRAQYDYKLEAGTLRFSAVNLDSIVYSYQHFRAVTPGNMVWELYVFRQNDGLCVYGVGAVKAFDLFGLFRDRLEPSLMGRVEAFFSYITNKIAPSEGKK